MSKNTKTRRPKRIRRGTSTVALSVVLLAAVCFAIGLFRSPAAPTQDARARMVSVEKTVLLPTPARPIERGEKLSEVSFVDVPWPRSGLTKDYMRDLASYRDAVAITALPPHLPVSLSALSTELRDSNAVIEEIPAGMRAITVKVDVESSVEGWARSGSFVDVILMRNGDKKDSGMLAKVIAENIRILSAGRSTIPLSGETSAPRAPGTVTLLVSQSDALTIKTASSIGKLTFSLRGLGDRKRTVARSLRQSDLIANAKDFIPPTPVYNGRAKGPDGKTYVLGQDSRWVRSLDSTSPIAKPRAGVETE